MGADETVTVTMNRHGFYWLELFASDQAQDLQDREKEPPTTTTSVPVIAHSATPADTPQPDTDAEITTYSYPALDFSVLKEDEDDR